VSQRPARMLRARARLWSAMPRPDAGVISGCGEIGPEEIRLEPVSRLLKRLATNPSGLDTAEVESRLAVYRYNTAASVKRSPLWLQFLCGFRHPHAPTVLRKPAAPADNRDRLWDCHPRFYPPSPPRRRVVRLCDATAGVLRLSDRRDGCIPSACRNRQTGCLSFHRRMLMAF
jgi:cation transport ATPase-like protein